MRSSFDIALRGLVALALGVALTACGGGQTTRPGAPPGAAAAAAAAAADDSSLAGDPQKTRQVNLDLIRAMLEKKQYYAALAYIEDQRRNGESGPELVLLEADARRHLGQRAQCEALYRTLIGSRFEAEAYHGLGLLNVDTDLPAAIGDLRKAADRQPTNVEIRSDLGYALMEAGRYTEAMPEISTAAELAPGQLRGRNNLVLLMLLTGNDPAAARLAQQSGLGPDALAQLRDEARRIRIRQSMRNTAAAAKPATGNP